MNDCPQCILIGGDDINELLPVIGLACDVSALGKLSEHMELTSVPDAVVVACHGYPSASLISTINPKGAL